MFSHIGIAAFTFLITNIDDLLILSVYFASPNHKTRHIVAGQYLGIAVLIGVSMTGILLGAVIEDKYVALLGTLPLLLGIRDLVKIFKNDDQEDEASTEVKNKHQVMQVALVTIANGGDNIGVYTPLFATIDHEWVIVYVLIFLILTAVLCFLGYWFVSHRTIEDIFARYGKIILPIFLILLGAFILRGFFID